MLGVSIEHLKWEDVEKDKTYCFNIAYCRYFHQQGSRCLNVIRGEPQADQCQGAR